ncbi:MAG: Hsp20/alpha crystallin family protein [Verrucomicrobiota bacterium]|jgi:HSP20 family protein|nr:Hsp20/alpha crystallin family protein [Verrucomicrobiota bacterium]
MNNPTKTAHRLEVTPASRVTETPEAYTLAVELPGVDSGAIELTLENRTLSVTGENTVNGFKDYDLVLNELAETRYRAAFDLPSHVDTANIKAANKNGLLILTLPKQEEAKPRRIAISAD